MPQEIHPGIISNYDSHLTPHSFNNHNTTRPTVQNPYINTNPSKPVTGNTYNVTYTRVRHRAPNDRSDTPSQTVIRYRERRQQLASTVEKAKTQRRLKQTRINKPDRSYIEVNVPYGDNIHEAKAIGNYRAVSLNVDGMTSNEDYAKHHDTGEAAFDYYIDMLNLLECKQNFHNKKVDATFRSKFRGYFSQSKITTSSIPAKKVHTTYLPGGIASIVGDPWVRRICKTESDPLYGRWISTTFQGKGNRYLTIISAYQVNDDKIERANARSTWRQRWEVMCDQNIKNPDPRQHFWDTLGPHIRQYTDKGHAVILMLDANDHNATNLDPIMQQLGMKDVYTHRHGPHDLPATYNRGSHRLDYAYCTADILSYITKCGYGAYDEICYTDHRHIFIDIDLERFLGAESPALLDPELRPLSTRNPRSVYKYRKVLTALEQQHNLHARWQHITKEIENTPDLSDDIIHRLETLEEITTYCKMEAERKCGKIATCPWSPHLRDARRILKYWNLWRKEFKVNIDLSKARRSISDSMDPIPPKPTPEELPKLIREAQANLKKVQLDAKALREAHLLERAKYHTTIANCTAAEALKSIIASEESRKSFKHLKNIRNKGSTGAMNYVLIPDKHTPGGWKGIFDPTEVQEVISDRNQKHFSQAEGTPFTIDPLRTLLGRHGDTRMAEDIAKGNTPVVDTSPAAMAILKQLASYQLPGIDMHITPEQIRKSYRVWRESTMTSPSGVHLGHYRSLAQQKPEPEPRKAEDTRIPNIGERVMEMEAMKSHIALSTGYVFKRWQKVISLMLEKDKGVPQIHRLRVIHLFEADLNLIMGIIWSRRLVRHGEHHKVHGEEQWARPGRNCEEVLLLKELTYMLLELTRTPGGTFDNDAKACYDRIVMSLSALRSRQLGIPPKANKMMTKFLEKAKYHIKTMAGVSDHSYQSTNDCPLHGPGQGGKASPSIWMEISILIMELMQLKSDGISFCDPKQLLKVKRIMDGFVDDTTAWANRFLASLNGQTTIDDIAHDLQITAQWWEELLTATGGKLELKKCFYYIISWAFDDDGNPHIVTETPPEITIHDHTTEDTVTIKSKDCDKSHKTLGGKLNPARNNTDAIALLKDKVEKLTKALTSNTVNNTEGHLYHSCIYRPSTSYGMHVLTATPDELDDIQKPAIAALLNAMGYNKNFPTEMRHAPMELGGPGVVDLKTLHGSTKAQHVLQHIRMNRSTGQTLQIALAWAQQIAGTSIPILEEERDLVHFEEKWLTALQTFLRDNNSEITVQKNFVSPLRRKHDDHLMDMALDRAWGTKQTKQINNCRLYLQVTTVSRYH